jgi:predicted alpha/beta superfamily hydrolase
VYGRLSRLNHNYFTHAWEQALTTIWQDYHTVYGHHNHSVSGTIKVAQHIKSPQLGNQRQLLVYLPPSYNNGSTERRYPVLYMQDGQNLFDSVTSFAGEWGVDEAMESLARQEGLEAIIVGIPNSGRGRLAEYSPFSDSQMGGGLGDKYVSFVAHTVKPIIDRDFRTLVDQPHCGIMGSSMGGLISLYAFFHCPNVFGFAGVMSPSLWFGHGRIFPYVQDAPHHPGKIYLDVGTREHGDDDDWSGVFARRTRSRQYYARVRHMKRLLVKKGYRPTQDLLHIEEKWANHNEAAWRRRLPKALRFFLKNATTNIR